MHRSLVPHRRTTPPARGVYCPAAAAETAASLRCCNSWISARAALPARVSSLPVLPSPCWLPCASPVPRRAPKGGRRRHSPICRQAQSTCSPAVGPATSAAGALLEAMYAGNKCPNATRRLKKCQIDLHPSSASFSTAHLLGRIFKPTASVFVPRNSVFLLVAHGFDSQLTCKCSCLVDSTAGGRLLQVRMANLVSG